MRTGSLLLSVAASVLVATTWAAASRDAQPPARPEAPAAAAIPSRSADFVGSEACQTCHQEAYAKWQASLHVQMTRPVAAANVLGDFSDRAALTAHGRDLPRRLHTRLEAFPGVSLHAARWAHVRVTGVLACGERPLARLERDDADS
jgi:hypothetical protein